MKKMLVVLFAATIAAVACPASAQAGYHRNTGFAFGHYSAGFTPAFATPACVPQPTAALPASPAVSQFGSCSAPSVSAGVGYAAPLGTGYSVSGGFASPFVVRRYGFGFGAGYHSGSFAVPTFHRAVVGRVGFGTFGRVRVRFVR